MLTSFPITNIIGKLTIEIKNDIFIKKPCIPKDIPSILAPLSSLIWLLISLSIAGGNIKAAPAKGIPIRPNKTKPKLSGIIFPKKYNKNVTTISIAKQYNIIFLYPYFLDNLFVG